MNKVLTITTALCLLGTAACSYQTKPQTTTWDNGMRITSVTHDVFDPFQMDKSTSYAVTCAPTWQIPRKSIASGEWIAGGNGYACQSHGDAYASQRGLGGVVIEQGTGAALGAWGYIAGQAARRPNSVSIGVTGGSASSTGGSSSSSALGGSVAPGSVVSTNTLSSTSVSGAASVAAAQAASRSASKFTGNINIDPKTGKPCPPGQRR